MVPLNSKMQSNLEAESFKINRRYFITEFLDNKITKLLFNPLYNQLAIVSSNDLENLLREQLWEIRFYT